MAEMYGSRWASNHGPSPSEYWLRELEVLEPGQVRDALRKFARSTDPHPPTLGIFLDVCKGIRKTVRSKPIAPPRADISHVDECLARMRQNVALAALPTVRSPAPPRNPVLRDGCTCEGLGTCKVCRAWLEVHDSGPIESPTTLTGDPDDGEETAQARPD